MENPCHTNLCSVLTVKTVTCPDHDTIVAAFEHASPAQCTADERAAMDYFLNYVLPCFDINLAKKWLHGTTTHQLLFGDNYVYYVAFALNLTSKFLDPGNVLYNASLIDGNGDPVPVTENPQQPKKKRRKKAVTKKDGPEIEADYYKHVNLVKMAMDQPGFTERMAAWDHELCQKRSAENTNLDGITAANRVSTMHATMENSSRTHHQENVWDVSSGEACLCCWGK
jgi:hypothetical protein